jgi:Flp pilus assembly secretin CpaC
MSLLSSQLILAGTLILSPSHPARVRAQAPDLWFSDPQLVQATASGADLLLATQKERGLAYAFGLDSGKQEATRLLIVSGADYEALNRCPQAPLRNDASPLVLRTEVDALHTLPNLASCGFRDLALGAPASPALEAQLLRAETSLVASGLRVQAATWHEGRRRIGIVGDPERARKLLGAWAPLYELNRVEAAKPGRTLIFVVTLFEFSRSRARSLGVGWPSSTPIVSLEGAGLAAGSPLQQLSIDFGESLGLGRVLAQPSLRTKPGEKAFFHSGGELPIRVVARNTTQMQWKNYGLILELLPDAQVETGASEIALAFKMELSEPDVSTAIGGTPGMITRKLESRFDLRVDETTVLTTMLQTRSGAHREGLPGLSELPILQRLFSKRADSEHETELWFAIRPTWEELRTRNPRGTDEIRRL